MLSAKAKVFLSGYLLSLAVICLLTACRGVEAKKPQAPARPLESQLQETQQALSAKEEENVSLTRQLEAARQTSQRAQEELKKQFDEAKALLEERIATLSKQLSSATNAGRREANAGRRERDDLRSLKSTLAETEEQRATATRELQDVKQFMAAKERELAALAQQLEAAKRVPPAKAPPETNTKNQEVTRTENDRQAILDKLSGVAPSVWMAIAVVLLMLLYIVVRQSHVSKAKGKS